MKNEHAAEGQQADSARDRAALTSLTDLASAGVIAADWAEALQPVASELQDVLAFVAAERAAGQQVLPADERVLAAFARPLSEVRVLVLGQDPYPTPGHPIGLSFATSADVRPLPRSLANVYRELTSDLGVPAAPHGDLTAWADQGVLLLNRVLTVRAGTAGSHRNKGWEAVTAAALHALAARGGPLVAVLWGNDARAVAQLLPGVPTVESVHPSPLSASRGFFGSKPFSAVNTALEAQGAAPIDWRLPGAPDSVEATLF